MRRPPPLMTILLTVLAVITGTMTGCGPGQPATFPVEGTVQFSDGSVPRFGVVEFFNDEHQLNARGQIAKDGSFSVSTFSDGDGAVAGRHTIVIIQNTGNYLTAGIEHEIEHDHGSLIDTRYLDYRTSGLSCEIQPGTNEVELVVEKRPDQTEDGMPAN